MFAVPYSCGSCIWRNVCKGGYLQHRYSDERGMNAPSVYCDIIFSVIDKISEYLLDNGLSLEELEKTLITDKIVMHTLPETLLPFSGLRPNKLEQPVHFFKNQ